MTQQRDSRADAGGPPLGEGDPKPPLRGDSLPDYVPPVQRDGDLAELAEVATVALTYVGNKPWAIDPYGQTGITWDGKGDVKLVPVTAAKALLAHPDEWARTSDTADLPTPQEKLEAQRKADEAKKNKSDDLKDKTKDELVAYAKKHLDLKLDPDLSKADMLKAIEAEITQGEIDDQEKRRNEVVANEAKKK